MYMYFYTNKDSKIVRYVLYSLKSLIINVFLFNFDICIY